MASVATHTLIMRFAAHRDQAGTEATIILQSAKVLGAMPLASGATGPAAAFGFGAARFVNPGCPAVVVLVVVPAALMAGTTVHRERFHDCVLPPHPDP